MYTRMCVCVCVRRRIRITIAPSLLTIVFPGYLKKKESPWDIYSHYPFLRRYNLVEKRECKMASAFEYNNLRCPIFRLFLNKYPRVFFEENYFRKLFNPPLETSLPPPRYKNIPRIIRTLRSVEFSYSFLENREWKKSTFFQFERVMINSRENKIEEGKDSEEEETEGREFVIFFFLIKILRLEDEGSTRSIGRERIHSKTSFSFKCKVAV